MNNLIDRPKEDEHDSYYAPYLQLVTETDLMEQLETQPGRLWSLLGDVTADEADLLHAPYTWSIKEVIGHCIDNERVFGYRALRFASGDSTDLPGYDQDSYVANSHYEPLKLDDLLTEFEYVRRANIAMLKRISPESWNHRGTNDGKEITVRAIAWLLAGHLRHHLNIIRKRIGKEDSRGTIE
ncbi:MAG: DinB family protein [Planctomycetota bacterium]